MADDKKTIDPLDGTFDEVVDSIFQPATENTNNNKQIAGISAMQPATSKQLILDLGIEVQRDVNGIEMGVLENGIPFLTQNGLAKISGAARSVIYDIAQEWDEHYNDQVLAKDRISFIKEYLNRNGFNERQLFIAISKGGTINYAYPDIVCMAILEYYAFEAKTKSKVAVENYRKLATYGLQKFIYESLHYTPPDPWKLYHARVSLLQDSAPPGYFIVFHEIAPMIVDLINQGLVVNSHTVPDGSVGSHWSKYWEDNAFDSRFGDRQKYPHFYPDEFPQSASNPQMAWSYPDKGLPEFRRWFREEYLITKFPKYLLTKANVLGGQEAAKRIGNMYQPKLIEKK